DLRRARLARAGEIEVGEGRPVEVQVAPLGDVLGRDPAVVLTDEGFGPVCVVLAQLLPQSRADRVDKRLVDIQHASHDLPASLTPPAEGGGYQMYESITLATSSASTGPMRSSQTRPSWELPGVAS